MASLAPFDLPANLEQIALSRFDELLERGEIRYTRPTMDIIDLDGIQVLRSTRQESFTRTRANAHVYVVSFLIQSLAGWKTYAGARRPRTYKSSRTVR